MDDVFPRMQEPSGFGHHMDAPPFLPTPNIEKPQKGRARFGSGTDSFSSNLDSRVPF